VEAVRASGAIALIVFWIACSGAACALQAPDQGAQATAKPQAPPPEQRVDINHASVAELMRVPGMTATWARRIVRFRPYRTKQDLLDQGVVTSQVYDRIKDYVIAHRERQ
jgi:competence protein ComEA